MEPGTKGTWMWTKKVRHLLACIVGVLFALVITGCGSIESSGIRLLDINIDDSMQVTATVNLTNINLSNFKKRSENKLEKIDIYYAYTPEKRTALDGYKNRTPNNTYINLDASAYDGKYTYSVTTDENNAFKAGSDTEWSKDVSFTIPEDAKGKEVDFLVVLSGMDCNSNGTVAGGSGSSRIFTWPTVTVKVDVGAGHESLFTEEILNGIATEMKLESVTIEGSVITLKGVHPSTTEYDMWLAIADFVDNLVEPADYMHNKESFRIPAYKPIDEYATDDDLDDDIYNETHESTKVSDNLTYYLFWAKPYEKLEIDNGNPTCGKNMWEAFPTVPDGFMVDPEDSYWVDENNERVEKFEGGKTYTFKGRIYHRPYGELWKYFIDPDNFTLTVEDATDVTYTVDGNWVNDLTFTAKAEHDWDEGVVDPEPTCTEKGVKTYTCQGEGCEATKTEDVEALGHKLAKTDKVEPTCTEDGTEAYWTCETCKKMFSDEEGKNEISNPITIEATDHDWGEWEVTKPATTTEEGEETRTCKRDASHKETRPISKLDEIVYTNTAGDGNTWTKGSGVTSDFTFKRSVEDETTFSHFEKAQVDGKDLASGDYTAESGSVIIKLSPEYLETLTVGGHTLTAIFDDGNSVDAEFFVVEGEEKTYKLTFNLDGGTWNGETGSVVTPIPEGVTIVFTDDVPTKTGYTFVGWKDASGKVYKVGDTLEVTADATFTAVWEAAAKPKPKPATPATGDPTALGALGALAAAGAASAFLGSALRRKED